MLNVKNKQSAAVATSAVTKQQRPSALPKRRINSSLADDLISLPSMDREALAAAWHRLYGTAQPRNISQQLMLRALACRMQGQALGGLKPALRAQLMGIVETGPASCSAAKPIMQINPGTRLLRKWHGASHEVMVLEDGVHHQGKRYHSLSQVARAITGAKWSGPLFFGLKKYHSDVKKAAKPDLHDKAA